MFDIKQENSNFVPKNLEGDAKELYETKLENLKLNKEIKIVSDEKNLLDEKFKSLNDQVLFFTKQFEEFNVSQYYKKFIYF